MRTKRRKRLLAKKSTFLKSAIGWGRGREDRQMGIAYWILMFCGGDSDYSGFMQINF